jgi:hypothetical protein
VHDRRSSLVFWLLAAATLCADIAAVLWLTSRQDRMESLLALNGLSGLVMAQVSIAAIWLVFRPRHDVWSWIIPPAVLFAASILRREVVGLFGTSWTISDYFFRTALQMLITLVILWLLMRTAMWRKLSHDATRHKWEFSLLQLFFWTTVTAIMSAVAARSTWLGGQPVALTQTIGVFCPPTIALGVVLIAASPIHWLARIVGYVAVGASVAMALATLWHWTFPSTYRLLVEFVIEALIVAVWVEWGDILACRSRDTLVATNGVSSS